VTFATLRADGRRRKLSVRADVDDEGVGDVKPELPLIGTPWSQTDAAERAAAELYQTFLEFVQADSWEESRKILDAHSELIEPQVGELLRVFVDGYKAELQEQGALERLGGFVEALERHLVLLEHCREDGWDTALNRMVGEQMLEAAHALVPPFSEFAIAGTLDEMRSCLLGHVELLAQSAVDNLDAFVQYVSRENESFGLLCAESLGLLQRCLQEGIDKAFANERIRCVPTPDGLVFGPYALWAQAQAAS
jgi:hypothetical protein